MRIQTNNRLAHYQAEYTEICEQSTYLNNQLMYKRQELVNLQRYLYMNNGDKDARRRFSECQREFNSINTKLKNNNIRLYKLQRQITIERNKILRGR